MGIFQQVPLKTFYFFKHQRTRLNTLTYIDNPVFGTIVKITPIQSCDEKR